LISTKGSVLTLMVMALGQRQKERTFKLEVGIWKLAKYSW
jgi:hypothetical protein